MKRRKCGFFAAQFAPVTCPFTARPSSASAPSTSSSSFANAAPCVWRSVSRVPCSRAVCRSAADSPAFLHEKATPGLSTAYDCTTCSSLPYSSPAPFIAFRRVGAL